MNLPPLEAFKSSRKREENITEQPSLPPIEAFKSAQPVQQDQPPQQDDSLLDYYPSETQGVQENNKGFIENVVDLGIGGGKRLLESRHLMDDVARGSFDDEAAAHVFNSIESNGVKPEEYTQVVENLTAYGTDWEDAKGLVEKAGVIGSMALGITKEAVTNPKGLAYFTADQAANMAPALAGMYIGGKIGLVGGPAAPVTVPLGALAGGTAGGFITESGLGVAGFVYEEMEDQGIEWTEENIRQFLEKSENAEKIIDQTRKKALGTAATDTALTLVGGRIAGRPMRNALKQVDKTGKPLVAPSMTSKVGHGAGGVVTDTFSEGASEAAGTKWATGEVDMGEAALESFGGLGGSALSVPVAVKTLANERKDLKKKQETEVETSPQKDKPTIPSNEISAFREQRIAELEGKESLTEEEFGELEALIEVDTPEGIAELFGVNVGEPSVIDKEQVNLLTPKTEQVALPPGQSTPEGQQFELSNPVLAQSSNLNQTTSLPAGQEQAQAMLPEGQGFDIVGQPYEGASPLRQELPPGQTQQALPQGEGQLAITDRPVGFRRQEETKALPEGQGFEQGAVTQKPVEELSWQELKGKARQLGIPLKGEGGLKKENALRREVKEADNRQALEQEQKVSLTIKLNRDELRKRAKEVGVSRLKSGKEKTKAELLKDVKSAEKGQEFKPSFMRAEEAGATQDSTQQAQKEWQEKGTESKYFKKWFGGSKVTDESGKPKVVYHGTQQEFTEFDKGKIGERSGRGRKGFSFTTDRNAAQAYSEGFSNEQVNLDNVVSDVNKTLEQASEKMSEQQKESFEDATGMYPGEVGLDSSVLEDIQQANEQIDNFIGFFKQNNMGDVASSLENIKSTSQVETSPQVMETYLSIENPLVVQGTLDNYAWDMSKAESQMEQEGHDGIIMNLDNGEQVFVVREPSQIKSTGNVGTFDSKQKDIRYKSSKPSPKTTQASSLQQSFNKVLKKFPSLNGKFHVKQSEKDLPADLQKAIKEQGMEGGFYAVKWGDEIFTVADNIPTTKAGQVAFLEGVVRHEGRHKFLDQLFPSKKDKAKWFNEASLKLKKEIGEWVKDQGAMPFNSLTEANKKKAINNLKQEGLNGMEALKKAKNSFFYEGGGFFMENTQANRRMMAEEVLVDMARQNKASKVLDSIIAKIVEWARQMFPNIKLTNAEVRNLIARVDVLLDDATPGRFIGGEAVAAYLMAGKKANNAKGDALKKAQDMKEKGESREKIWKDTGWWEIVPGQWAFEIDDKNVSFKPGLEATFKNLLSGNTAKMRLGDYFKHDELYKSYPELKDTTLVIDKGKGNASYDSSTNIITLHEETNAKDFDTIESIVLHEVQHAIQAIEGFAKGGRIKKAFTKKGKEAKLKEYHSFTGEVEARLVQERMNMTPEQRKSTSPWDSLNEMLTKEGLLLGGKTPSEVLISQYDVTKSFIETSDPRYTRKPGPVNLSSDMFLSTPEAKAAYKKLMKLYTPKGKLSEAKTFRQLERYEKLASTLRDDKKDIYAKQKELEKHIKEHLNPEDRFRVLHHIKNISKPKTEKGRQAALESAIERVEQAHEKVSRKDSLKQFTALLNKPIAVRDKKRGVQVGKVSVEAQEIIKKIRSIVGMSQENAETMVGEIRQKILNGEDISVQEREKFDLYQRFGGLKEKDAKGIQNALEELKSIRELGRALYKERYEAYKQMNRENRQKVIRTITGGKDVSEHVADRDNKAQRSLWQSIKDSLRAFDDYHQSWEFILDKLSRRDKSSKTLEGWMTEYYRELTATSENQEYASVEALRQMLVDKQKEFYGEKGYTKKLRKYTAEEANSGVTRKRKDGKRVSMPMSQNKAYTMWQVFQQPSMQKVLEQQGFDQKTLTELESYIKPEVMKWAEWQLNEFFPQYGLSVNEVYREMFQTDMNFHEKYSPVARDFHSSKHDNLLEGHFGPVGTALAGSVQSRVSNNRDLLFMDGDSRLIHHIIQMEHFKHQAPVMRELRSVFGSSEVRNAIKEFHGDSANKVISDFMDRIAIGGQARTQALKGLDLIRANFTKATLGANPVVFLKQLASIPAYTMDIPAHEFAKGFALAVANPKKAHDTLMQSKYMQNRYKMGWDRDIMLYMSNMSGQKTKTTHKITDALMLSTKLGDKTAILLGGYGTYNYHYNKSIKEGMSKEKAKEKALFEFEASTRRAQQSGNVIDLAYIQNAGGSFGKLFTMYMTAPLSYYRNTSAAVRNIIAGRGGSNWKRLFVSWVLLQQIFQFIASGFEWDEEKQARALLVGPLNGLLIVRDLTETFFRGLAEGERAYMDTGTPPPLTLLRNANSVGKEVNDYITTGDTEELAHAMVEVAELISKGVGMPWDVATRIGEGWKDLATGETDKWQRAIGYSESSLKKDD